MYHDNKSKFAAFQTISFHNEQYRFKSPPLERYGRSPVHVPFVSTFVSNIVTNYNNQSQSSSYSVRFNYNLLKKEQSHCMRLDN